MQSLTNDFRSVFQKCKKYHTHNIFLGVIDCAEDGTGKVQKLLEAIPAGMTCKYCKNHAYIVGLNHIPVNHFLISGDLIATKPTPAPGGVAMFIFGVFLLIAMLVLHLYFKVDIVNKNFANYATAISAFLISAAILAERSSSKLSRLSALLASFTSILAFFANYE